MLDRVREALFSTLGARVEGARVLDLFAGSGSLGIEALSRGAARVRAVERGREALAALRGNLAELGLEERCEVVRDDALEPRAWWPAGAPHERWAELVLDDPPYPLLQRRRADVLGAVARLAREVLVPGGLLVLHAPRRALSEGDFPAGLALDERVYGSTSLWYVEPAGEAA